MSNDISDIIKSLNVEVGSEYFATRIHGGGVNCIWGEYVRHEVSVWVSFGTYYIEYQTGNSFKGGDYRCPSDDLDFYQCSHDGLSSVIYERYDEDDGLIDVCGHKLSESRAKELIAEFNEMAHGEFYNITSEYSEEPDDYYIDLHDGTYHKKEEGGHYCISNECHAHSGDWVLGTLYRVIDTRDGSVEEVVAESEEDAARRTQVLISNCYEEYIDRDYRIVAA